MSNHLKDEKSPYLLQHADNPVEWYPWGQEALLRARAEDKPLLVSIGYSACHWCHVMAHESFENESIASIMNEHFINVKVDREERPDVDAIYMDAVQALSGHGGWPLNVFLTPDGRPFFGGTYYPPAPRHGLPSWSQVLETIHTAYRDRRDDLLHNATVLTDAVQKGQQLKGAGSNPDVSMLDRALRGLLASADWQEGGFGGAPKFPQPLALEFLLRSYHRTGNPRVLQFVRLTLDHMANGGIYDQLGGGFHRYTVDGTWTVPHFEKMLYDNALLARIYLYGFQVTGEPRYREVVEETLDYLLRDMRSPEGGFYAAEDADSEGVEGKFYVWTPALLTAAVGPDLAEAAALRFGITRVSNFEGSTVLTRAATVDEIAATTGLSVSAVTDMLADIRHRMVEARRKRVAPGKDTKILVSWNALAIRVLAEAGRVLERQDYLDAAIRATTFILDSVKGADGLIRSYRDGPSTIPAFLEDYAFLAEACLSLSECAPDPEYLHTAARLADEIVDRFWDEGQQTFFDAQAGEDSLVVRPRSLFDNPIPSGNASALNAFLWLSALTGDEGYSNRAARVLADVGDIVHRSPLGFSYLLCTLDAYLRTPIQVGLVGTDVSRIAEMVTEVFRQYRPTTVLSAGLAGAAPLLENREMIDGHPTAFVCEHFACRLPVATVEDLRRQLDEAESRAGVVSVS